jgi:hypothetical protein
LAVVAETLAANLDDYVLICFYAFMRTTVELPPELLKQAKAQAAARGESLKALFTRAVTTELGKSAYRRTATRVRLPILGDPEGKPVDVSNEDIARSITEDDLASARRALRVPKK